MPKDPIKRSGKKSWTVDTIKDAQSAPKKEKYDFEKMKAASTSNDSGTRKAAFIEYFERFSEFPSFLFDNDVKIDPRLAETMQDLSEDKESSKALLNGITALLDRLPSR
jgi:hypothetical protein